MAEPWYEAAFSQDYLDVYRPLIDDATEEQVEGLLAILPLAPGARILDLCCGHGRHAIELAARGYRVTGYDLSQLALDAARAEAEAAGVALALVQGDMRRVPFAREFDLVTHLYSAFGYFDTEDEDLQVLAGVRRALVPGGLFLQDVGNPSWILRSTDPVVELETDDFLLLEENEFDQVRRRYIRHHTFTDKRTGAPPRRYLHSIRAYEADELAKLCEAAGLEVLAQCGSFQGDSLGPDGPRIITVARRPA